MLSKFSFHANREESLWKRKEAEYGHSIFKRGHDCPKDIYYCPETSPLVLAPGIRVKEKNFSGRVILMTYAGSFYSFKID